MIKTFIINHVEMMSIPSRFRQYEQLDMYFSNCKFVLHPEILSCVIKGSDPPFRPSLDDLDCPVTLINLMEQCWAQEANMRPGLSEINKIIKETGGTG